jgi:hypothetical protein
MAKKRKKIPTYREWYEAHREQFERTERLLRERIAYHQAKADEARAARGEHPA